jgi:glycosyltransferase involved in cell wall biosynthesis
MQRDIILFAMMTYDDFQKGIDNTNAHIFRWLQTRTDIGKICFVDFNQFSYISRLKFYIKNRVYVSNTFTLERKPTYRFDKINEKLFRFCGISTRQIPEIVKKFNFTNTEIWSFNPFDISFIYGFPGSKKIFYGIDDWRKNSAFRKDISILDQHYSTIEQKVDYIFTPSRQLVETLWHKNAKATWISNAVDVKFYKNYSQTPAEVKKRIDDTLMNAKPPIVGYMGVITPERVDFNLVEYLIKNNPDKLFVFAGPVWGGFDAALLIHTYSNVRFIGMVYYPEMPYLLSKFNVCIIPHRLSAFIQSMNPKKLKEYLAAGKPVVTTPVKGIEELTDVINIAETSEAFNQKIQLALTENTAVQTALRQKSVEPHSWDIRFAQIESVISR